MEQPREEDQVGGAADGEKLGQGLNQGEYDRLKKRHECFGVLCGRRGNRRDFGRPRLGRDATDSDLSERLDNDSRDGGRRQRRLRSGVLFWWGRRRKSSPQKTQRSRSSEGSVCVESSGEFRNGMEGGIPPVV